MYSQFKESRDYFASLGLNKDTTTEDIKQKVSKKNNDTKHAPSEIPSEQTAKYTETRKAIDDKYNEVVSKYAQSKKKICKDNANLISI